jgi:hypothetical protein
LHVNGQTAQINDCAFRHRNISKYLIFVDVDEAIVPNWGYARNYEELLKIIDVQKNNSNGSFIAQYQFRNGFFSGLNRTDQNSITEKNLIEFQDLTMFQNFLRHKNLFPYGIRLVKS